MFVFFCFECRKGPAVEQFNKAIVKKSIYIQVPLLFFVKSDKGPIVNRVDIRSKFLKIGRVSLRFTTMLVKTDFSFLWGGSKNAPPTHPRRVDNFGFVIQVYEFFGGNKSKFLDQNCIFFDGKPKMTKIFGFEI